MNSARSLWLGIVSCGLLALCTCTTAPRDRAVLPATQLPGDVPMLNRSLFETHLFLKARLDTGEEFEWMMDTGSPNSELPKSLEPALGTRLGSARYRVPLVDKSIRTANTYSTPRIFLGGVPLVTPSRMRVDDTPVLGMDILRHYCIQLDFDAGVVRFLDSGRLNATELGKVYPLLPSHYAKMRNSGPFGEQNSELLIDTGYPFDAHLAPGAFKRFQQTHDAHRLPIQGSESITGRVPELVLVSHLVWNGKPYTNLIVEQGSRGMPNLLGLRLLARHLVTFDFPNGMMYLKRSESSMPPHDKALEFPRTDAGAPANRSQPVQPD